MASIFRIFKFQWRKQEKNQQSMKYILINLRITLATSLIRRHSVMGRGWWTWRPQMGASARVSSDCSWLCPGHAKGLPEFLSLWLHLDFSQGHSRCKRKTQHRVTKEIWERNRSLPPGDTSCCYLQGEERGKSGLLGQFVPQFGSRRVLIASFDFNSKNNSRKLTLRAHNCPFSFPSWLCWDENLWVLVA